MTSAQRLINFLGYAGLLPFVVPAMLVVADSQHSELAAAIAGAYAFGIISFLTGSWWGLALAPGSRAILLASNCIFLVALFSFVFAPQWWPLAAALLLVLLLISEQNCGLFTALPRYYRRMRAVLTGVAGVAMLILYFAA